MKIKEIKNWKAIEGEYIIVTLEEYPHAQPTFLLDDLKTDGVLDSKKLEVALKAWEINQKEVDAINEAAKNTPSPTLIDISALKTLEGKEVI